MLESYVVQILMVATVVSVAVSTRLVLKVSFSLTLLKILALRSLIKLVIGLFLGVLLSIGIAMMHEPSVVTAVALFALTCVIGSLLGLYAYKWALAKVLNLHFSFRQFLVGYFAEVTITSLLSAVAVSLLMLASLNQ
ncbi:hypothetical protein QUN99_003337 [Vibrio parahaemolyticus]|nr:hypothetical protein [Vibrio parahaemolyticus]